MGVVPLHAPVEALNVCPCCPVPLIVGIEVLDGAVGLGEDGGGTGAVCALATAGVAVDVAAAEPFLLVAVTRTRSLAPTAADVGV